MDLETEYLGLKLDSPLMAGASPLADTLDSVRRLEDAGASAIVMRSLFEEQITREQNGLVHDIEATADSSAEALSYFPKPEEFVFGSHRVVVLSHGWNNDMDEARTLYRALLRRLTEPLGRILEDARQDAFRVRVRLGRRAGLCGGLHGAIPGRDVAGVPPEGGELIHADDVSGTGALRRGWL